jgi:ketosteroid isomerase-like protein
MAGEHSELIGRIYGAWNRGDVDGVLDCCRADGEVRPFLSDLAGSVYRGHEGIRRWYADANEPWDRLLAEPEKVIEDGDRVLIRVHAKAHGHESGIDVDAHIVHLARVEGGRITRIDGFASESDARRALAQGWPGAGAG